jgi:DNA-binding HxlR family transcriptional regulator
MLVDRLKEASEDGKLTKEEAAEAMRMAVEYLQSHLTPGALQILQAAYGPIEEWLESYLEAKLAQQKYPYIEVQTLANPQ